MGVRTVSSLKCCCEKDDAKTDVLNSIINSCEAGTRELNTEKDSDNNNKLVNSSKNKSINDAVQRSVTGMFIKPDFDNKKPERAASPDLHSGRKSLKGIEAIDKVDVNLCKDHPEPRSASMQPSKMTNSGKHDSESNNNLKNYTFSSETNNLVKGDQILRCMIKSKESNNQHFTPFIPKASNKADEVILQFEFMVNNYTINNKLNRTKTKNLSNIHRYVLLTRQSLKICKSKDHYISYGTTLSEIMISHITNIELVKNPFSKIMLHTLNITQGKENTQFSLSSEDGKEVEIWLRVLNFLQK